MFKDEFNSDKIIQYWLDSSEEDFETMLVMFKAKRYTWSLFIGHIVIEKLLKAFVVKQKNDHAPFTHDLSKLASLSGLNFNEERLDWLDTITVFNLNARYDSYKQVFSKKCTPEYTQEWIDKIKALRIWIKEKL
jgi:HEPN domain-containing protein